MRYPIAKVLNDFSFNVNVDSIAKSVRFSRFLIVETPIFFFPADQKRAVLDFDEKKRK